MADSKFSMKSERETARLLEKETATGLSLYRWNQLVSKPNKNDL